MAVILNIETATPLCSVALSIDGSVVSQRETFEDRSHASRLTVFIKEILEERRIGVSDLDAVAVGKGPGSYTGLRIGVSTAKGLCYGSDVPLIALDTPRILCNQLIAFPAASVKSLLENPDVLLCPMIDARRMEVYTGLYDLRGETVEAVSARIIGPDSYSQVLSEHTLVFFGTGMDKCKDVLKGPHTVFVPDIFPHAASLALLAEKRYELQDFENVAYFEPFYLKDFMATTPKKVVPR